MKLSTVQIIVAGLGLPWLGFLGGLILARLCKQPCPDVLAIAIETGVQNTGIAIFMLSFSLGQPEADLTTGIILCCITIYFFSMTNQCLAILCDKLKYKHRHHIESKSFLYAVVPVAVAVLTPLPLLLLLVLNRMRRCALNTKPGYELEPLDLQDPKKPPISTPQENDSVFPWFIVYWSLIFFNKVHSPS